MRQGKKKKKNWPLPHCLPLVPFAFFYCLYFSTCLADPLSFQRIISTGLCCQVPNNCVQSCVLLEARLFCAAEHILCPSQGFHSNTPRCWSLAHKSTLGLTFSVFVKCTCRLLMEFNCCIFQNFLSSLPSPGWCYWLAPKNNCFNLFENCLKNKPFFFFSCSEFCHTLK